MHQLSELFMPFDWSTTQFGKLGVMGHVTKNGTLKRIDNPLVTRHVHVSEAPKVSIDYRNYNNT
jgi:hypothetical protein